MPDSFDNWTPDAQFWDDAWADMDRRLEADRKARPFWFTLWPWVLTTALMAFGFTFLILGTDAPATELPNDAAFPILEATSAPIAENVQEGDLPLTSNQEITSPAVASIIPETNPSQNNTVPTTPIVITTNSPEQTLQQAVQPNSPVLEQVAAAHPVEAIDSPPTTPSTLATNPPTSTEPQLQLITTDYQAVTAEIPTYLFPINQSLLSIQPPTTAAILGASRTTHSLRLLASQGTHVPGFGYGVGYRFDRQLGRRWQLGVGLTGRHEQWPLRLGATRNVEDDLQSPVGGSSQDPSLSLEQLDRFLEGENLDYITISTLGIELQASYALNRKWSVFAGAGLHYVLLGQGPRLEGSLAEGQAFNTDRTLNLEDNLQESAQNILAIVGFANFDNNAGDDREEVQVNRWQLETQLGIGYQLSSRWSLDASIRYRPTAVYGNDNLQLGRLRAQIGLNFRL